MADQEMVFVPVYGSGRCPVCHHHGSSCTGPHAVPMLEADPATMRAAYRHAVAQLALTLPYVEDAEKDPAYKAGAVKRLTVAIRQTVEAKP